MNESSCKIAISGKAPVTMSLTVIPLIEKTVFPSIAGENRYHVSSSAGYELCFTIKEGADPEVGGRDTRLNQP